MGGFTEKSVQFSGRISSLTTGNGCLTSDKAFAEIVTPHLLKQTKLDAQQLGFSWSVDFTGAWWQGGV